MDDRAAYMKKIEDEVDTLIIHYTIDELKKRFFKDFGCINFRDEDFFHELNLAREFHHRNKELLPELHDEHEIEPYNCYHKTVCKCGYSEAYDSGD